MESWRDGSGGHAVTDLIVFSGESRGPRASRAERREGEIWLDVRKTGVFLTRMQGRGPWMGHKDNIDKRPNCKSAEK